MTLGTRTVKSDDQELVELYTGFEEWSEIIGDSLSILVDVFPPLRRLPDFLFPVRAQARAVHETQKELFLRHWNRVKAKIASGTALVSRRQHDIVVNVANLWASKRSIAIDVRKAQEAEGITDDLASYLCGFLVIAGSDTIATQLSVFLLAMVLHPEAQSLAQEEVDRVCGDRLPEQADAPSMPYIHGCLKETCRWLPAAILGIPHALMQDDEYMGYKIPKNAVVINNVWYGFKDSRLT